MNKLRMLSIIIPVTLCNFAFAEWDVVSGTVEDLDGGYFYLTPGESGGLVQQQVTTEMNFLTSPAFVESWGSGSLVQVSDLGLFFAGEPGAGQGNVYYRYDSWEESRYEVLNQSVALDQSGYPVDWIPIEVRVGAKAGVWMVRIFDEVELPVQVDENSELWAYLEPDAVNGVGYSEGYSAVEPETTGELAMISSDPDVVLKDPVYEVPTEVIERIFNRFKDGLDGVPDFSVSPHEMPENDFLVELYAKAPAAKAVSASRANIRIPLVEKDQETVSNP